MESRGDGGGQTLGRLQDAGQERDLVQRGVRLTRVHQVRDGVQQTDGTTILTSGLVLVHILKINRIKDMFSFCY